MTLRTVNVRTLNVDSTVTGRGSLIYCLSNLRYCGILAECVLSFVCACMCVCVCCSFVVFDIVMCMLFGE